MLLTQVWNWYTLIRSSFYFHEKTIKGTVSEPSFRSMFWWSFYKLKISSIKIYSSSWLQILTHLHINVPFTSKITIQVVTLVIWVDVLWHHSIRSNFSLSSTLVYDQILEKPMNISIINYDDETCYTLYLGSKLLFISSAVPECVMCRHLQVCCCLVTLGAFFVI